MSSVRVPKVFETFVEITAILNLPNVVGNSATIMRGLLKGAVDGIAYEIGL